MMKQAWRSYVASLHPRNLKKMKDSSTSHIFNLLWWLVIYPSIVTRGSEGSDMHWVEEFAYLTVKLFPVLFMSWSNVVGRLPMPKRMYLTPMKEDERVKYIKSLMTIKIGVPVIMGFTFSVIWMCFYKISMIQLGIILFAYLSIGIGNYMCSELVNKHNRRIDMAMHGKNGEVKDAWLNTVVAFTGILVLIALEPMDFLADVYGTSFDVILLAIILVGLLIGDIVIIKTRYKDTVDNLCNYEIAHCVLAKKENV